MSYPTEQTAMRITHMILTPTEEGKFLVSNVGTPYFFPHDGDIISMNDVEYIKGKKGWTVEIKEES